MARLLQFRSQQSCQTGEGPAFTLSGPAPLHRAPPTSRSPLSDPLPAAPIERRKCNRREASSRPRPRSRSARSRARVVSPNSFATARNSGPRAQNRIPSARGRGAHTTGRGRHPNGTHSTKSPAPRAHPDRMRLPPRSRVAAGSRPRIPRSVRPAGSRQPGHQGIRHLIARLSAIAQPTHPDKICCNTRAFKRIE